MNKLVQRANQKVGLGNVALLLVSSTFLAQLLGFMRTKLVNANFSAIGPNSTDSYFAAFNIPDLFFYTLAAGALGVAFIPVLVDKLNKGEKKKAIELSVSLLNLLAVVMAVVGLAIFFFAKPLIHNVVAPGLDPQQLKNSVTIMRLLAFNPLLFTISGILTALQQSMGRFFFYAIAPMFYNACIIVSIFVFKNNIGLVGLGIGALAGAILQLLIILFGLIGTKFSWNPKILWRSRDFHTVLRNLPARSIDQGIDQIEAIADTRFARGLGVGNVSYYNNAFALQTVPIMLIGSAISTAVFPRLTHRLAQNRPDLFRRDFLQILRAMIWLAAPVVVISFFTRGYLARLIFSRNAPQISLIFGYLSGAIFFRIIYTIISRWFYARKDTKTPLFISLFVIALNIVLAYKLSRPNAYGVAGLALAQSTVAAVEVLILTIIMLLRDHKFFDRFFWAGILKIMSVTGFSVVATYIMISILPLGINDRGFVTLGAKLSLITAVTFMVHVGTSSIFGLEEARPVIDRIRRIVLRPIRIEY
ncbi:MAG TPA: lipid II flippase MurJ [Candidatus Saccharimonadales bacterium]|nr:lipid II flippase MurJ [Candidatus Saccharimonadales bacterium]